MSELFGELYDGYVIQKETLCKWRDSKDQSAGKGMHIYIINIELFYAFSYIFCFAGVAVKSLNPFFNSLFNDEAN